MSDQASNFLEAFNARHLTPSQIARDFIAPHQFYQLLDLDHCVLLGPRGSGKTTLLKMLQADALKDWNGVNDNEKPQVKFIGVFVPADIRWARQLDSLTNGALTPELKLQLCELSFGTAVLLSLVETLERIRDSKCLSGWESLLNREQEVSLVQKLAELWCLPVTIPSLNSLKHGLRVRQTKFPGIANQLREGKSLSSLAQNADYLNSDWLESLATGIGCINDIVGRPHQHWALLLDELEIIPAALLRRIVDCLRSTYPNIIFKLALSPTGSTVFSLVDTKDPTSGNDFKLLRLWYNERTDLRVFSGKLLYQALARRGLSIEGGDIVQTLGKSSFVHDEDSNIDEEKSKTVREYRHKPFADLLDIDESFKTFIDKSKIDINNLHSKEHGSLIRKIYPLVLFRGRILKKWDPMRPLERGGRIGLEPYIGYPNLLDLTEGNPRWILTLADELASEAKSKGQDVSSVGVQTSAVKGHHSRYAAMLKVYPVDSGKKQTVYGFLSALANSIRQRVYFNSFSSDPAMSFTVDTQAIQEYGNLLETCVQLGALVIMNPESSKQVVSNDKHGLIGVRLRICYRLAPEFFLPLRSTSHIRLVTALGGGELMKQGEILPRTKEAKPVKSQEESKTPNVPIQTKLF